MGLVMVDKTNNYNHWLLTILAPMTQTMTKTEYH